MNKFLLLIIIAILSASLVYSAQVDTKVTDALNTQNEVSVIVKLKDDYSSAKKQIQTNERISKKQSLQQNLEKKKDMVRKQQTKVLSSLNIIDKKQNKQTSIQSTNNHDLKLTHKYSTVNMFSGKVTRQGLEKLRNNPNVETIHLTGTKHISLDLSVPLINATNVWSVKLNDTNITGSGETVCIIDTGIDFNHTNLGGRYGIKVIAGYRSLNSGADVQDCDFNNSACMDDNGHGTHVGGTVTSNHSTYTGVAPDASLIAIKVCNSTGSCDDNDVIEGINWCIDNASKYNISVISLSLGDNSAHSTYCNTDAMASSINTAVAQGIVVTVAAGNCQAVSCTAGPSSPACVENATAIGTVDDNDIIDYQRGALFELLAPGKTIKSANKGGGFRDDSGTSMSTPHAAGAVALLQQFSKLQNGTSLTSDEIKGVLNNTGKRIDDDTGGGGSGYNFSRIDVYTALRTLDVVGPSFTFVAPTPANNTNVSETFVIINITSSEILSTAILEWNNTNETMEGSGTNWYFNKTNLTGWHNYTVYGNDTVGNFGKSDTRFVLTNYSTAPNITSYYPVDTTPNITEEGSQLFNISYVDLDGDPVNVIWSRNGTSVSNNSNYTFIANYSDAGVWNITVSITDGESSANITWLLNVTNTNVPPNITSYEPSSNPTITEEQNQTFAINYSDFDNDAIIVTWYLNNSNVSSKDNYTFTQNYSRAGIWNITVVINDTNATDSFEWALTVTNVNRQPILSLQNLTVNENDLVNVTHYANATDPDGDSVTITYGLPLNSSAVWQTTYQNSSNTTALITASDGTNETLELLTIQVIELNDTDNDGYYNLTNSSDPNYDCNDTNANIHPGATDICGNGIDEDCDGSDATCSTTPSSSGGGGGSSAKTINIVMKETPQSAIMKVNDKITFSHKSQSHTIRVSRIRSDGVDFYIASTPFFLFIPFGTSTEVDIDGDNKNDIVIAPTKSGYDSIKLAVSKVSTATCSDGIRNQGEDLRDCGGPCPPCKIAPNCYDKIKNQDEEDVDCGGKCKPCPEEEKQAEIAAPEIEEQLPEPAPLPPPEPKSNTMWYIIAAIVIVGALLLFTRKPGIRLSKRSIKLNKDLDHYIRKSLGQGKSKKEIKSKLTNAGWSKEQVDNVENKFDSIKKD